jgi:hypothetical protein
MEAILEITQTLVIATAPTLVVALAALISIF